MSELESDVKQLQDELEKQQVHLREADREKTRAVQELSEQNQRLLDQLSRVSQLGGTAGHGTAVIPLWGKGVGNLQLPGKQRVLPLVMLHRCGDKTCCL